MQQDLTKEFAADLVRKSVARGASAAEVILKERTEFSVTLRFGEVEMLKESTDRGFGLRVLVDGRQASVSGSDFSNDAIDKSITQAVEMARVTSPDETAGLPEPSEIAT